MPLGVSRFWNRERLIALQELARLAENCKQLNGNMNWSKAILMRPILHKVVNRRSAASLSKAWSRQRKVLNGICYRAGCFNKIEDTRGQYCLACRKKGSLETMRSRSIQTVGYSLRENKDYILEVINKFPYKFLLEIAFEGLLYMKRARAEEILGSKVIKNMRDKINGRKKGKGLSKGNKKE